MHVSYLSYLAKSAITGSQENHSVIVNTVHGDGRESRVLHQRKGP